MVVMAMSNSNMDYNNCVANCKALFPNSEAALVACINGCAKVNSPAGAAIGADLGLSFETEVQKVGRDEYLKKIRSAARSAGKLMADFDSMDRMEPLAKRYLTQVHELVEFGAKLSEWDDAAMARYAGEVAWAKFATDLVAAMARDNSGGGGGSGPTCVTRCADEYDQCVRENRCDTSGWVCVCCMPCSLQYMGCVAACTIRTGGFGGIVIA